MPRKNLSALVFLGRWPENSEPSSSLRSCLWHLKCCEEEERSRFVKIQLREKFQKELVPSLLKQLGYKNVMQVPRLQKIVINAGINEAVRNPKVLTNAVEEITAITGQRAVITKAKKAISNFKLRE